MDIINHAIAGAAVGAAFDQPILGAAVGVLPDIMLLGPRRALPSKTYDVAHSGAALLVVGAIGLLFSSVVPLLAMLSHLLLDVPTHGPRWAPRLLWPLTRDRFSFGEEWEWFSASWWNGFCINAVWSASWLLVSLL